MKRKDIKTLPEKTSSELRLVVGQLLTEIKSLSLGVTKDKNVHAVYQKRKDVARILTVLKDKELTSVLTKGEKDNA